MRSLRAFQDQLKNVLVRNDPRAAEALWGNESPARLHVYKNNIHSNWRQTLEHDFPLLRAQFDDARWEALQEKYFSRHPPKHWELNTSIAPFLAFVQAQKLSKHLKELADYEWRDLEIFIDRSTVKKGLGVSNPTIRVSVYHHQIFNWVQAGAPLDKLPEAKPEVLIFYRDTKNTCHIREADPLMLLLIDHFQKPDASLDALEPIRRRLLPSNTVPLLNVLTSLKSEEILLL